VALDHVVARRDEALAERDRLEDRYHATADLLDAALEAINASLAAVDAPPPRAGLFTVNDAIVERMWALEGRARAIAATCSRVISIGPGGGGR